MRRLRAGDGIESCRMIASAARRARRRGPRPPVLDLAGPPEAHLLILTRVHLIPKGRVCTYGRIAAAAGFPGRARMVGRILRESPLATAVPWHRVVNASGRISERSGAGPEKQRRRLESEGVVFTGRRGDRIDLKVYLWDPADRNAVPLIEPIGRRGAAVRGRGGDV